MKYSRSLVTVVNESMNMFGYTSYYSIHERRRGGCVSILKNKFEPSHFTTIQFTTIFLDCVGVTINKGSENTVLASYYRSHVDSLCEKLY